MNRYKVVFLFDYGRIEQIVEASNQSEALKNFELLIGEAFPEYAVVIYFLGKVS